MPDIFQIVQSNKVGLNSKDSYIVTRNATSFLRILGGEPVWQIMTATASEDHGRIKVCSDQLRLIEAALRLRVEGGGKPMVEKDRMNREYVKVCEISQLAGETDQKIIGEMSGVIRRFFEIYDEYKGLNSRPGDEMRELYDALAIDDQGDDVYLSDGVWLTSDGSIHDRGR